MMKILIVGFTLTAGTGVIAVGLSLAGARNSQKSFSEQEAAESIFKSEDVVAPEVSESKCEVYQVKTSNDTEGQAILKNKSFWDQEIRDLLLTQSIKEACDKFQKAYVAKQNQQWVYRENDQAKKWTVVTS